MFRSLLEASPDGILIVECDGLISLANPQCEKLFGFRVDELVGQPLEMLVPRYVRAQHAGLREGFFANMTSRPMGVGLELVAERKDGSWIPVEICLNSFAREGQRPAAIAIVRDTSEPRRVDREIRRFNEELRRSNEELENFAFVASHDLQEPLRMVSGYVQLLASRNKETLDAASKEYVAFAVDGVKRMQDLIRDLLSYARVGTRSQAFATFDPAAAVAMALRNLGAMIERSGANVRVDAMPARAYGDERQIVQVLQNLVGNALKFHRPGVQPQISISAEIVEGELRVSVADKGMGIEAAYAEKVFVIFQRLNGRDDYPGTGIGLAIAKKVVERHGGTIWFDSTLGEGATFHFTLPLGDES